MPRRGDRPMTSLVLHREQWIPRPLDQVFAFFSDAKNLGAITPAWLGFRILSPEPIVMRSGATNRLHAPLARVSRALGDGNYSMGSAHRFR